MAAMTFLELCQMTARESGTVSGNLPSSAADQTGRLAKIVYWTANAWKKIQTSKSSWKWMRGEFSGNTSAGTARYTAASFNITRLSSWITEHDTVTIYKQSTGVSDEGPISFIPWAVYRSRYERSTQTADKPVHYTISPTNEFCLGPKPDDTYVVRGEYRKSAQDLDDNEDIPELPSDYHEIIAWYGLLLLAEHDEAELHIGVAARRYSDMLFDLMRDQLPEVHIAASSLA
jgi:hypothetical protein